MYQLFTIPGSCSTGIHALLNQLNLPYKMTLRDDVEDYTALVPTNQVPALRTPETVLTEGAAIVLYLLANHGEQQLVSEPEFLRWLMFNYATLHPAYGKLFASNGLLPAGPEKVHLMQTLAAKTADLWAIVDQHLAGRETMFGNRITVLDYLISVYVRWGNVFPELAIPVGQNVLRLVDKVCQLPEFQQAFVRESVTYAIPDNALAA
ncbi:glutathione S-transferase [Halioxenophilus sp. WMMB6]|uniref:glutathione S-transferase family protein n=1 Tax=Halioxenophilus sp. WMMB6 TaxID=3073815 RepID=UPI00295ECD75|nr:glutathione S-transferase [Halioxenophilus sp. WMMB6]